MQCKDALFWRYDPLEKAQFFIKSVGRRNADSRMELEHTVYPFAIFWLAGAGGIGPPRTSPFCFFSPEFCTVERWYYVLDCQCTPSRDHCDRWYKRSIDGLCTLVWSSDEKMFARLEGGIVLQWLPVIAAWMAFEHLHEYWGLAFPCSI